MSSDGAVAASKRFQLRRRLGAGGFGTVYEAFDRKRNATVAVKMLRDASAGDLYRFKQEFRAVSDLSHRNLVTLYELVSEGDEWLFSMELVDGVDFLTWVRGSAASPQRTVVPREVITAPDRPASDSRDPVFETFGPPSIPPPPPQGPSQGPMMDRLLSGLRQIAEGLLALHEAGIAHRDIKPANVLCTPDGRVVLLDFGILQDLAGVPGQATRTVIGTPDYMSPEQASEQPITPASDWYSVGVLLYEALTGSLPFAGTTLQVLRQKTSHDPAPPASVWSDVPPALDALCMQLMQRDPSGRPSGEEVIERLRELQSQQGALQDAVDEAVRLRRKVPFVGRQEQLAALSRAFEETLTGKTVVALVNGSSGAGKSALCQRYLRQLVEANDRVAVFNGRCFEHEDVPFKALDGVIDSLSRFLQRLDASEASALLPRDSHSLARLFPVLEQAPAVKAAPKRVIADDFQVRQAAFAALRELMLRLSDRRPIVIYIDDIQWGDLDGIALLLELLRPADPPPLLLVATYRSDDERSSPAVQALTRGLLGEQGRAVSLHELHVGDLSSDEATELVRALLPNNILDRASTIAAEADGNAFLLTELSRSVATGLDLADGGVSAGTKLDGAIRNRVAQLSPPARELLTSIAVAGQPVSRGTASRAAFGEGPSRDDQQALAQLRSERLVRIRHAASTDGSSEELLPYHDRVREAVVAGLTPDALATHHLRLARALVAFGAHEPERLVFHFERGGDRESAAHFALEASAQAHRALAYHRTVQLCRVALTSVSFTLEERRIVKARLADAMAGIGRPREAAERYLALVEGAEPVAAVELRRVAAEQYFSGGYMEEGRAVLKDLLEAARLNLPATQFGLLVSACWYQFLLAVRGQKFRPRAESSIPREDLLQLDTCAAVVHSASADALLAGLFVSRLTWHALRAGESRRVALGISHQALIFDIVGIFRKRIPRLIEETLEFARASGDPYVQAITLRNVGHMAHFDGRWRESSDSLLEAVRIAERECVHATAIIDLARTLHVYNTRWRGALRELDELLPPILGEAVEGGRQSYEIVVRANSGFLLLLRDDDPVRAEATLRAGELRIATQSFNVQHFFTLDARVNVLLYAGRGDEAWQLLSESRTALRASGMLLGDYFVNVTGYLIALAALASGQKLELPEKEAKKLARSRRRFGPALAKVIHALVARRRGQTRESVDFLESALRDFDAYDMQLHAAAVRLRLGQWLANDAGEVLRTQALDWMASQGIRNPQRMANMLVPE